MPRFPSWYFVSLVVIDFHGVNPGQCRRRHICASESHEVSVQVRKRLSKDFELDLSVSLPPGITILFGPSGAGKTTLLDCIAGLVRPDAGRIATRRQGPVRQRARHQSSSAASQSGLRVSGPGAVSPSERRGQRRVRTFSACRASNASSAAPPFWSRSALRICARAGPGRFPVESGRESHWPAPW